MRVKGDRYGINIDAFYCGDSYALFRNFFCCFIADRCGSFNGYKLGAFGLLVTIETLLLHIKVNGWNHFRFYSLSQDQMDEVLLPALIPNFKFQSQHCGSQDLSLLYQHQEYFVLLCYKLITQATHKHISKLV